MSGKQTVPSGLDDICLENTIQIEPLGHFATNVGIKSQRSVKESVIATKLSLRPCPGSGHTVSQQELPRPIRAVRMHEHHGRYHLPDESSGAPLFP